MNKTKNILFILLLIAAANSFAQDQCKPIGWATWSGRSGGPTTITGGGNATPITVTTFADLLKYATDSQARVIYVDGTLGAGWSGTSGDRLTLASNKTIIGIRAGTQLKAPILIKNVNNVIIRNLVIKGPGSDTNQAWDNINVENGKNIWIDHCEFWDGQDGNSDAIKGADNLTYTWNIFGYTKNSVHNLSNLIASSDNEPVSVDKLNITFMDNWFRGIAQRGPRCRYGNVHVVNNLYTTDGLKSDYAISAGFDCQVLTENNDFVGTNVPIYTGHKAGTSGHEVTGNLFEGTSGNTTGYGTAFTPPYEYKSFMLTADKVNAAVKAGAGATLASPTACVVGTSSSSTAVSSSSAVVAEPATCAGSNCAVVLQTENFCNANGVAETKNAGFLGTGYVNLDNALNTSAGYVLTAGSAVERTLYVRYANGGTTSRDISVLLNNQTLIASVPLAATGSWTTWVTTPITLTLPVGTDSLVLRSLTADGAPNIDWIGWMNTDLQPASCVIPTRISVLNNSTQIPLQGWFHGDRLQWNTSIIGSAKLNIYDNMGHLLQVVNVKNTQEATLSNLKSGYYFVQIVQDGKVSKAFQAAKN